MGKLAGAELAIVEEHLLVCERCRAEVESVELMIAALHDAPAEIGTVETHVAIGDTDLMGTADSLRRVLIIQ